MITCHLPLRTKMVRFSELAGLIADAIHNNRELHEWQRCKYWANQELINLARNGSLKLRNPDTLGRLDIDPGTRDLEGVLSYTVMTLDDLKLLLADRHIEVSTGEEFQKLVEELAFEKLESALSTALSSQADQEAPPVAPAVNTASDQEPDIDPATHTKVNRGWVLKKAALIKKYTNQWPKITGDFHSASENGLSKAAKAPGKGDWFESDALDWARQRGKLIEEKQQVPSNSIFNLAGKKHMIDG